MSQSCNTSSTISGYAEDAIKTCADLPLTGTNVNLIVALGIILLVVGFILVALVRLKDNRIPESYETDYESPYSDLSNRPFDYERDGE